MNTDQTIPDPIKGIRNLIRCFDDIEREGLKMTPVRHFNYLKEFLEPEPFEFTTFEEDHDEMVIVKNIDFYSLCEHHILPFFGTAAVAYIPSGTIVGLSKIARTVNMFSRRLQNQERITKQISEFMMDQLHPRGVAVVLKARHMCMEMRGIQKPGSETITSAMRGVFENDFNARQEFLKLIE